MIRQTVSGFRNKMDQSIGSKKAKKKKSEADVLNDSIDEHGWRPGTNMQRLNVEEALLDNLKEQRGLIGMNMQHGVDFQDFMKDFVAIGPPTGWDSMPDDQYGVNIVDMQKFDPPHDHVDLVRQSAMTYARDHDMYSAYQQPYRRR